MQKWHLGLAGLSDLEFTLPSSIYYLNSPHCSPCTQITLRNQLFCDFQVHSRSWKFLHTSLKVWLILETCASYQCASSISFQLMMFSHTFYTLLKSSCLFKCFQLLSLYASCWNFNHFFSNSAFVWLFSTVLFQTSPQIARITLFLKILLLNTGCVPNIHPRPISSINNS